MSEAPLMPKATAVWLVENTSLTFDQVAEFCKLHPLEVKGIADGEVAAGIKGHDPITSGQLLREEIEGKNRLYTTWTESFRNGENRLVEDVGHVTLHFRRPDAVLQAIRDILHRLHR